MFLSPFFIAKSIKNIGEKKHTLQEDIKAIRPSQLDLYYIQGFTTGLEEHINQTHVAGDVGGIPLFWVHTDPTFWKCFLCFTPALSYFVLF